MDWTATRQFAQVTRHAPCAVILFEIVFSSYNEVGSGAIHCSLCRRGLGHCLPVEGFS
jgi:hypothetical protein